MVVERFAPGTLKQVERRFRERGRMIPDSVRYIESWMSADGSCCYQLMDAPSQDALAPWLDAWSDLVGFEVVEVEPSAEYWGARAT